MGTIKTMRMQLDFKSPNQRRLLELAQQVQEWTVAGIALVGQIIREI
jgi:hypothetical protein